MTPASTASAVLDAPADSIDHADMDAAPAQPSADEAQHDSAPTFEELGVPMPLVKGLARDGKITAFPIQAETLPDSLQGRDILGRGATGSGKTLAYAIPLLARLEGRAQPNRPRGLVLAPTRELANQINDVLRPLASDCNLTTTTIYGGVRQSVQTRDLRRGVDIVVACPGRLKDLIDQGRLTLDDIAITVLDEADEMADMGFLPDVSELLGMTPADGQRLLFSATLDHGVDTLVRRFLNDPKVHEIDSATAQVSTMTQHIFQVSAAEKPQIINELASGMGKRILFTKTKIQAEELAASLIERGIPTAELHGNLSQSQRDRNLKAFSSDEVRVMVATDVAARGMDISGVELVAQLDPPQDPKSFLHRSGRTARAGQDGDVVTLVLPRQKRRAMQMLHRAGLQGHVVRVDEDSDALLDLVGETAPLVEGWSLEDFTRRNRRSSHDSRDSRGARNSRRGGGYGHHGYGSRDDRDGSDRRRSNRGGHFHRSDRFEHADRFDSTEGERSEHSDRSDYRDERRGGRRNSDFDHGSHSHGGRRNFRDDAKFDSRRNFHDHADSRSAASDNDDWSKPFDGRSDKRRSHADFYDNREGQSGRRSRDFRHSSDDRRHASYSDRGHYGQRRAQRSGER
ncbi:DEAD/DEAH box helicase [Bifidobacterium sp.]|jgi:superfamily II DNA/RNA helicase|nr:DEAD/DEAH box helicase [Bifidobacterium sp.]MCH4208844.1 DEAD/DEAH box helicase [Bifidobacterium sp.]